MKLFTNLERFIDIERIWCLATGCSEEVQDDAFYIRTREQIQQEIMGVIDFIQRKCSHSTRV